MAYSKMTFADFKKKLNDGSYADATAARRGIGKAGFSEDEKTKAQKLINKYFGEEAPAPKKKAGKASKGKAAKAKAAKAAKPAVEEAPKKRGRKPKAEKVEGGRKPRQQELFMSQEDLEALGMLNLSGQCMGTIYQAIATMKLAKEVNDKLTDAERDQINKRTSKALEVIGNYMDGMVGFLAEKSPDAGTTEATEVPAFDPEVVANLERTMGTSQGFPGQESPVVQPAAYQSPVAIPAPVAVHPTNGQYEGHENNEAPPAVVPGPNPIS